MPFSAKFHRCFKTGAQAVVNNSQSRSPFSQRKDVLLFNDNSKLRKKNGGALVFSFSNRRQKGHERAARADCFMTGSFTEGMKGMQHVFQM